MSTQARPIQSVMVQARNSELSLGSSKVAAQGPRDLRSVVEKTLELPAMPFIASKIMKAVDDPRSSTTTLAGIVEADPGITAWVMRVSNSAVFGRRRAVTTLAQAIALLGFGELRNLVVGASIRYLYRRFGDAERASWEHSVATGLAARLIATRISMKERETAFLAGQLHDVGEIVLLAQMQDQYLAAKKRAKVAGIITAEEATVGFAHTDVGSLLLQRWNLPPAVEAAAFYHHDLDLAETLAAEYLPMISVVALADAVTSRELGDDSDDLEERIEMACTMLSISPDLVDDMLPELQDAIAAEKAMMK